jgi:Rrf2 family protein
MNFTKTTSYSLKILSFMAENENNTVSASHLHMNLGIPYSYLRQLLSDLGEKGFIKSEKGRNGGYYLTRNSTEIYLIEIVEATEGIGSFDWCLMGVTDCRLSEKCALHELWSGVKRDILTMLNKTSLADLLYRK